MQDKVLALLGLATRARKTVSGEFSVEKAVKNGKACLVIVAENASDNTKKQFTNMCAYYQVPIYFLCNKEGLGHAMGLQMRASVAVVDSGFAKAVEKQLKNISK